jgi:hypothetical protein
MDHSFLSTFKVKCLFCFLLLLFFTDLKTSLNYFIPVHLTVISPHHRHLCFYFWTFVCSNSDIFHLLNLNKLRTRLATVKSACLAKLPSCEATFKQHVLRASLQTYVWYRAILQNPLLRVVCSLVGEKTWITPSCRLGFPLNFEDTPLTYTKQQ